jgi:hypothetical protein
MSRRVSVALGAALALSFVLAPVVLAECMFPPLAATEQPHIGFAFEATVERIERSEAFESGSGLDRYRVELDIGRVHRGRIERPLVLKGADWDCGYLHVPWLAEGDRLFIAAERLDAIDGLTWFGDVLAWRRVGDGWRFYEDVLVNGSDPAYYLPAARTATTTAEIVRIVERSPLPDTATAPLMDGRMPPWANWALIGLLAPAGFVLSVVALARRASARRPSG